MVDRAPASATIRWDEVTNFNNGDTVKYKIRINNRLVDSNRILLIDTIRNLSQDSTYDGRVYAYTKSGDTVSAPFFLDRLNGFIFFGDQDYGIQCYSIYSGKRAWRWEGQSYPPGRFLGIPTIVNNVLYINNSQTGTWAFNAKTGEKIWNTTFTSGYPNGSSVNTLLVNGNLYTIVTGGVYSLSSSNGGVIWSYPLMEYFDVNPVMAGSLLITARSGSQSKILAINAETGLKVWDLIMNTYICKNPVVHGNLLVFGGGDGKVYAVDNTTGKLAWSRDFSRNYHNFGANLISPVIYNNLVIVHSGNNGYYGLNALTGVTVWDYSTATPSISSPIIGDNKLYFSIDDYPTSKAIALDAATGKLLWQHVFNPGTGVPSPIFAKNRLYFGGNGYGTMVLNAKTGAALPTLLGDVLQYGMETIVDDGITYYLAESGMMQ